MDLVLSQGGGARGDAYVTGRVAELMKTFDGACPLGDLPPRLEAQPRTDIESVTVGLGLLAQLGRCTATKPLATQILDGENPLLDALTGGPRSLLRPLIDEFLRGVLDRTTEACISMLLWLETVGFDVKEDQLEWLDRFAEKTWWDLLNDRYEVRMKYLTAYVQARNLSPGDEPPPPPKWLRGDSHFLGGAAYVWFTSRAGFHAAARNLEAYLVLNNSVTGLKKRQPEIPLSRLIGAEASWYKSLAEEGPRPRVPGKNLWIDALDFGGLEDESAYQHSIRPGLRLSNATLAEYTVIVREIARAMAPGLRAEVAVGLPGLKSRIDSRTMDGGTLELYRLALVVAEARHRMAIAIGLKADVDFWTPFRAAGITNTESGFTIELWGALPRTLQDLLESTVEDILVRPMMLPEPFKVRAISLGHGLAYYRTQAIQKNVHAAMQRLPELRVTRESNDHDIVDVLNDVVQKALPEGWKYRSGDYTGATDNLLSQVSEVVVEELARAGHFSLDTQQAFRVALTGHTIVGPDGKKLRQKNGQLMGSPVSFPVLCIANLALSLVALRRVEGPGSRPIGRSGVAINGDDIGFACSDEAYIEWGKVTGEGGLSPSVGKNFSSRDFLQLNSKMFRVRVHHATGVHRGAFEWAAWERVPQASLAVLAPPRNVSFQEFCLSAPQWQRTFLDESTGDERDRLNSLYLRCWKPYLVRLPSELMNWFVPRELGGFGLEPTRPVDITVRQQHIAAYFRDVTTPEAARLQKLSWATVEARASVHRDVERVMKTLQTMNVVEWRWLEPGEEEFDTSAMTQSMILGGWSTYLPPPNKGGKVMGRIRPAYEADQGDPVLDDVAMPVGQRPWAPRPQLVVQGVGPLQASTTKYALEFHGGSEALRLAGYALPSADEQEKTIEDHEEAPEDESWLFSSIKLLRKAAKKTGRAMSPADIAAYVPKLAGYRPRPGWVEEKCEVVRVSLRTDKLIIPGLAALNLQQLHEVDWKRARQHAAKYAHFGLVPREARWAPFGAVKGLGPFRALQLAPPPGWTPQSGLALEDPKEGDPEPGGGVA